MEKVDLSGSKRCDRCTHLTNFLKMSIFNKEMLCPFCQEKEEKHPKYEEALRTERRAVSQGDLNFPGIGKPSDL